MEDNIDIAPLKKLAQTQRQRGQHNAAAGILQEGIDRLEGALTKVVSASEPADSQEIGIAAELADLYGILGGIRREQGELLSAAAAYDAGFRYESSPRYRLVNSYNALNRVVTRLLLTPGSLSDPDTLRAKEGIEFVDVRQSLRELQAELRRQVNGVRSKDFWAAGDLALTCALNGDDQEATDAFQKFTADLPPPAAYDAYSHLIGALAQLDTPRKGSLGKVKALFEMKRRKGNGPLES
ncbi:MAG TPA: hypothetical protein VIS96_10100 [Terrimicrobiaceae bacterium]